ncbi:MAG: hypothetical protein AAF389_11830 [Gemmatimonadota bacterium]
MLKRTAICALSALLLGAIVTSDASAQDPAERFGEWWLDGNTPPPAVNIMTYEPWGDGGMSITVRATNARGQESEWGYNTLFDGVFRAVQGQEGSETAVEWVNERTTRILNARNGEVTQIIINTLSEDGQTIENEYIRMDSDGKPTSVGRATYRRIDN